MQSGNKESFFNNSQTPALILLFTILICSLIAFQNKIFQPSLLLKKFGEFSIDPEIAFTNNKPTFLEFYAEWCEVCKETAPKISELKEEYENDINFVFLNVDNPKWEKYIRDFKVNGIPQVNLFDEEANLEATFIGKQQEKTIKESLNNLNHDIQGSFQIQKNSEFSIIKENKNYQSSARSHG